MRPAASIFSLVTLVAFAGGQAGAAKRSQPAGIPAVTLRVINALGIDDRLLLAARKESIAIMRRAGIRLVWLSCAAQADASRSNPCYAARGPLEFWLWISGQRSPACSEDVLAFSELDDVIGMRSATVYYPAVLGVANRFHVDLAVIIAAAIAHEVGHLILGRDAHTAVGLMSPQWGESYFKIMSFGCLGFDARQAQRLRDGITMLSAPPPFAGQWTSVCLR